jgi:hypothetical protein
MSTPRKHFFEEMRLDNKTCAACAECDESEKRVKTASYLKAIAAPQLSLLARYGF